MCNSDVIYHLICSLLYIISSWSSFKSNCWALLWLSQGFKNYNNLYPLKIYPCNATILLFPQIGLVPQLCYLLRIMYLHLNFRIISEIVLFFPVTNMNRQGEIIWLVLVAMSVAYLLWILLAGGAIFDCYISPSF